MPIDIKVISEVPHLMKAQTLSCISYTAQPNDLALGLSRLREASSRGRRTRPGTGTSPPVRAERQAAEPVSITATLALATHASSRSSPPPAFARQSLATGDNTTWKLASTPPRSIVAMCVDVQ